MGLKPKKPFRSSSTRIPKKVWVWLINQLLSYMFRKVLSALTHLILHRAGLPHGTPTEKSCYSITKSLRSPSFTLDSSQLLKVNNFLKIRQQGDHMLRRSKITYSGQDVILKYLVHKLFACFQFKASFIRRTWQWEVVQYWVGGQIKAQYSHCSARWP